MSSYDRLKIYALPLATLVVGLLVSVVLYWQLSLLDRQRLKDQFTELAQNQSRHLQWNLTNYRNALHSTVDLFSSTERVELSDFQRIARLIQNRYPEVLALEWLPKVSLTERESFVTNIRRQYEVNYRITELESSGNLRPAAVRETYYPVTYVHPFSGAPHNQRFLGFDHFSRENRRRAIRKARNQGSVTITPSTVFHRLGTTDRNTRSPNNNLGVILYKPVFETRSPDDRPDDQHEIPIGVIALSLKLQSVVTPVFEGGTSQQNVAVFEHTANPNNPSSRLIYTNQSPDRVERVSNNGSRVRFQERFPVSDRSWSVLLWPSADYLNARRSWAPLLALAFGFLLTGVLSRGAYWASEEFLGRRKEFHSLVDTAEDAIVSTDDEGVIRLWNRAAQSIFGYDEDDVIGEPLETIIAPEERDKLNDRLRDFSESDTPDPSGPTMEFTGRRSDGSTFPIELTLSKWNRQGEAFFTVIIRDITERKQRENRLEELTRNLEDQVEQRTQELEQFVYAASHDLREPARVIQTYADFLKEDLGESLDENVRKDLRFIGDSARQMNELIDSLLKLSRIGQGEIDPESISVDTCVDQALEQQEERLATDTVELHRDPLPTVTADPALLTDLYQNLLNNAVKHATNGSVSITLTAEENGDEWILGVRDNGPGIDPEYQDKIFEPFKHLQQSEDQEGTGIGLSICRHIVERHGGRIWVESTPGEGAHFRFSLPKSASA